jgi:predicted amidophosphoribosyltransferase
MLFGIHPMMGWIAYLILRYGIDPRKKCDKCKESIKLEAQICRYCRNEMSEEEVSLSIKEYEDIKK